MILESYTCDVCNLQRPETAAYLFVIGKRLVSWCSPQDQLLRFFSRIKQHLGVPFFVEIIYYPCDMEHLKN
jgi:hypothetical protein